MISNNNNSLQNERFVRRGNIENNDLNKKTIDSCSRVTDNNINKDNIKIIRKKIKNNTVKNNIKINLNNNDYTKKKSAIIRKSLNNKGETLLPNNNKLKIVMK